MNSQTLLEMKGYGHQLLTLLAEKRGVPLDDVYAQLAHTLGVKKKYAHFGTMDAAETQRAISCLRKLLKKKYKNGTVIVSTKKQEKKELYKMSKMKLPQAELRAALAQITQPKPSLFQRIKQRLF